MTIISIGYGLFHGTLTRRAAAMRARLGMCVVGSLFLASCVPSTQPAATGQPEDLTVSSAVANGITVTGRNFRIEGARLAADICFDIPTTDDWTIYGASLAFDGQEISQYESELLTFQEPSGDQPARRCDTLYFHIGRPSHLQAFTITVTAIAAFPREGEMCTDPYLAMYQRALDARNSGITVKAACEPGIDQIAIADKPSAVSLAEAQNILYSEDLFLELRGRMGPWVLAGRID